MDGTGKSKVLQEVLADLKKSLNKICNLNVKDDGGAQAFRIKFNCIVSTLFCLEGVVDTKYAVVYFDISNRERKKNCLLDKLAVSSSSDIDQN